MSDQETLWKKLMFLKKVLPRFWIAKKIQLASEPELQALALDPNPVIRKCLASALPKIDCDKASPILVALLGDQDLEVSIAAACSLGKLKPASAANALVDQLKNDFLKRFFVKSETIVRTYAEEKQRSGDAPYMRLVTEVARALTKIGKSAEDALIKAMTEALQGNNPRLIIVTTVVLAHIGSEKAKPLFVAAAWDEKNDQLIRAAAFYAISKVSPEESIDPMIFKWLGTDTDLRKEFDNFNFQKTEALELGLRTDAIIATIMSILRERE